ncbi:uncharacterized membrane protein YhaH (DUF805 family) [Gracilibacillus halotolerans]|uniref:Uncharacterized membrane protein YhaH (DUF805 family) n=1 Tax=Gracilibacillus halotolerans TaxID=74386 RepID=A0A841RN47_9BACI|nr:uncharacterized membrane protein YhaH (DUF805 family) [Gracilibacillus halotolerans]
MKNLKSIKYLIFSLMILILMLTINYVAAHFFIDFYKSIIHVAIIIILGIVVFMLTFKNFMLFIKK